MYLFPQPSGADRAILLLYVDTPPNARTHSPDHSPLDLQRQVIVSIFFSGDFSGSLGAGGRVRNGSVLHVDNEVPITGVRGTGSITAIGGRNAITVSLSPTVRQYEQFAGVEPGRRVEVVNGRRVRGSDRTSAARMGPAGDGAYRFSGYLGDVLKVDLYHLVLVVRGSVVGQGALVARVGDTVRGVVDHAGGSSGMGVS